MPGPSSGPSSRRSRLRVVLFSGGRGSGALTSQLVSNPGVHLTLAINGYDDGASTGEVRRCLGDSLGPSDFRKNASRVARVLGTAPAPLIDLVDLRLDVEEGDELSVATALADAARSGSSTGPELSEVARLAASLSPSARALVADRLGRFAAELAATRRPFSFRGCSLGNVVFAGAFLLADRRFNAAVDDYCALLGLPAGMVENVTDGTNAFLVAIDGAGRLLGSEEEIVDAKRGNRIRDIFLLDVRPGEAIAAAGSDPATLVRWLEAHRAAIGLNPRLAEAVRQADLIVYAPGTQHSSLFPSYLTPGLSEAIGSNLTAIKLLVTNIQADAEITGSSAVDIIERAVYYLKEKGRLGIPTPCLITHYLLNDPQQAESEAPYVPLGRLESLEDPRLVRVANYEEGATGRHDASKILGPFVDAFVARSEATVRVAILLYDADSPTKVVQSILEMIRGGIRDLPVSPAIFHDGPADLEPWFVDTLGMPVTRLHGGAREQDRQLRAALEQGPYEYVVLFESSGMYNGEDIASLASHLRLGRLDAVWGSRRLSVKDIHESYRLKYRHRTVLGAISYVGSHVLSLLYLALYGRYVSDTLSAARIVRASDVLRLPGLVTDKLANQHLLSLLLRRKAEMFEVPVQFFPLSPADVRRTSPLEGARAVATVLRDSVRRFAASPAPAAAAVPGPEPLAKSSSHVQVP